jgi:serine/threonine protein kinase
MLDKFFNVGVIDFGLSAIFQSDNPMLFTKCGSLASAPPEMILGQPYNAKCDIWSSGIILYKMVCGKLPFYGENQTILFQQILSSEPKYEGISPELTSLIQQCLKKNPDERISLLDIQNQPSLLLFDYSQLLKSTLTQAITFYDELLIDDDSDNTVLQKCQIIKNRILIKEKITTFMECLNQGEFMQINTDQYVQKPSHMINMKESRPNSISRRFSEPANQLFQRKELLSLHQKNQQRTHFPRNRRNIIQQTIVSSHHTPILESAKTGNSGQ